MYSSQPSTDPLFYVCIVLEMKRMCETSFIVIASCLRLLVLRTPFVTFELVQKFNMVTWEDLWKDIIVNPDRHTLQTLKLWFGIGANNLKIDDFGRIGDHHVNIGSSGAKVLQLWQLLLTGLDTY